MRNRDTTGKYQFFAKPSLNPNRSVVLSSLLPRDWQLKDDGGREGYEVMCKLYRLEL